MVCPAARRAARPPCGCSDRHAHDEGRPRSRCVLSCARARTEAAYLVLVDRTLDAVVCCGTSAAFAVRPQQFALVRNVGGLRKPAPGAPAGCAARPLRGCIGGSQWSPCRQSSERIELSATQANARISNAFRRVDVRPLYHRIGSRGNASPWEPAPHHAADKSLIRGAGKPRMNEWRHSVAVTVTGRGSMGATQGVRQQSVESIGRPCRIMETWN